VTRLSRKDIADALKRLGLSAGDHLYVHSSLSSMGFVVGGAPTVVEAVLDVIGPHGTFMVPTFTFSSTRVFDVLRSPSKTGAITEAVRTHPRAVRSWHPTHAPCAIGPLAEWLVADHLLYGPLDIGCPEDRMAKVGGWVLLLGVDHRVNSTVHVGEAYAGAAARRVRLSPLNPARPTVITPEGERLEVCLTSMPGCSGGFGALEAPMREAGLIRDGMVGSARCQLMRGQDIIDRTVALLRSNPYALACGHPACTTCAPARTIIGAQAKRWNAAHIRNPLSSPMH